MVRRQLPDAHHLLPHARSLQLGRPIRKTFSRVLQKRRVILFEEHYFKASEPSHRRVPAIEPGLDTRERFAASPPVSILRAEILCRNQSIMSPSRCLLSCHFLEDSLELNYGG